MLDVCRLDAVEPVFDLQAARGVISDVLPPWVQELGIVVETIEAGRPPGAPRDWQPGAVLRLPFSSRMCRGSGLVSGQALSAVADSAMVLACSAVWNGYRPMTPVDQTMHFLRPVAFDVLADARVVRVGRTTTFGRVMLYSADDKRPVGMVASAYAMV